MSHQGSAWSSPSHERRKLWSGKSLSKFPPPRWVVLSARNAVPKIGLEIRTAGPAAQHSPRTDTARQNAFGSWPSSFFRSGYLLSESLSGLPKALLGQHQASTFKIHDNLHVQWSVLYSELARHISLLRYDHSGSFPVWKQRDSHSHDNSSVLQFKRTNRNHAFGSAVS